jgi:hypothetical protein
MQPTNEPTGETEMNRGLIKAYLLYSVAVAFRIAAWHADDVVKQASAASDFLIGVFGPVPGADGDTVDVTRSGIVPVEYGTTVTRGQRLTTDSVGRAVPATDQVYTKVISGGSAGNLTVTGIKTTDTLVSVVQANIVADTGTSASGNKVDTIADLTSEFTISAADTINNTGHTDTTSDKLIVTFQRKDITIGRAEIDGLVGDVGLVMLGAA